MNIYMYEDDILLISNLKKRLKKENINVYPILSKEDLLKKDFSINDIILIDLNIGDSKLSGLKILKEINHLDIHKIILTGVNDKLTLIRCFEAGAHNVFVKNNSLDDIENEILNHREMQKSKKLFNDKKTNENFKLAKKLFLNGNSIIITGESGVGKTYLANHLHQTRKDAPLISVNCAAIPEDLAESQLFGHVKGAFSGAIKDHKGHFLNANNGTIFLDEITSLSLSLQAKILKAIEEKVFYPVGSSYQIKSNFNVIAATNENIPLLIESKLFREDLYYRLNGFTFSIPPLRLRKSDIVKYIQKEIKMSSKKIFFSEDALAYIANLDLKGNYRDLKRLISLIKNQGTGIVTKPIIKGIYTDFFLKDSLKDDLFLDLYKICCKIKYKNFVNLITNEIIDISHTKNESSACKTIKELGMSTNKYYSLKNKDNYERRYNHS